MNSVMPATVPASSLRTTPGSSGWATTRMQAVRSVPAMLPRLIPLAVAGAAIAASPAQAGQTTFKVVKAVHTSSSAKTASDYAGSSTASWTLAKATNVAPNRIIVSKVGGRTTGLGQVNVAGSYAIDATTRLGHCAWTAATGDAEHPASAPQPFSLAIGPDPRTGKGLYAGMGFGVVQASLSNAYLGTECSTTLDGEPDADETAYTPIRPAALKRKKVTLRWTGATDRDGVRYRWSTTIVLKRR